jgi:hypothetical protein
MRKALYVWAALGVSVPFAILTDLNLLGQFIFRYEPVLLLLWPSSLMLSGFTKVNYAAIIGLVISIAINVVLYACVGLLLSSAYMFLGGRREHEA